MQLRSRAERDSSAQEPSGDWFENRRVWYAALLSQTLEFAGRTVPHYRAQGWHRAIPQSFAELQRVPLLSKADVAADPARFLSRQSKAESFHCTSGTTGRRLIVYGNTAEQEAAEALLGLRSQSGSTEHRISLRLFPNVLRVFAPPRRVHRHVYNVVINFSLSQTHHHWFDNTDHLVEILSDDYHLGDGHSHRISLIHATPPFLLEFVTNQLLSRKIDPRVFKIDTVAVSGGFMTSHLRRFIEKQWNATCIASYSCTEINAAALEATTHRGAFLPDPAMFCEVLDPESGALVADHEVGEVVLTSLCPFQTSMPFLRYRTGDLAVRIPLQGRAGELPYLIRPIGRIGDCFRVATRCYVGTIDVLEAVGDIPEVPQFPYPRYRLTHEALHARTRVVLDIETMPIPRARRAKLEAAVARRLEESFCSRHHHNVEDVPSFKVHAVGKGDLNRYTKLYPDR